MKIILWAMALVWYNASNASTPINAFRFEKLVFHTTECYGFCKVYHLEINNKRAVMLHAEKSRSFITKTHAEDSARVGYFEGKLVDTTYQHLIIELIKLDPDKLKFGSALCCDAPIITLIIYHNGKRLYFRSMFPPEKANKIIGMLYDISADSPLNAAKGPLQIEPELPDKK